MLKAVLLFALGFIFLIKGGDWFVDGSVGIAHKFKIPEILIGATIVSIGTTLPEVLVSASSAVKGIGGIAYGNAIGSVICNTALIAAITIAFKPSATDRKSLKVPVIFFFVSAAFYLFNAYVFGEFSRVSGIILFSVFVIYIVYSVFQAKKSSEENKEEASEETDDSKKQFIKDLGLLIVGAALIAVGANLLVDNGQFIARELGVPETVIALTFVALGTSLPELITAISSLIKGHSSLSLGNIIGANLFNLVLVNGVSTILAPFAVPAGKLFMGYDSSLIIELPLMLLVMLILTVPALCKEKLYRWQGILLLALYVGFCAFQFVA